jgi:hypothetical protein
LIDALAQLVMQTCSPYVAECRVITDPEMMRIRHIVFSWLRSRFPQTPVDEFRQWITLENNPRAPGKLEARLNHQKMVEDLDSVPDWVYALYWAFNPNFKPTFEPSVRVKPETWPAAVEPSSGHHGKQESFNYDDRTNTD